MRYRTIHRFRTLFLPLAFAVLASCATPQSNAPGPVALAAADQLVKAIAPEKAPPAPRPVEFRLFAEVFDRIRFFYVDQVDEAKLMQAAAAAVKKKFPDPAAAENGQLVRTAMSGMLASLDAYSTYMDQATYKRVNDRIHGQFSGIGLRVNNDKEGRLTVISPIDGTPAFLAGIQPGDHITHADGQSLAGLSLADAVMRLRGPAGSQVTLTISPKNKPGYDVTITRAVVQLNPVRWEVEKDIGYIRISSFTTTVTDDFTAAVLAIRQAAGGRLKGYVIDLRNNPGGSLNHSVSVTDAILNEGEIVSTRGRNQSRHHMARNGDITLGLPIVVLVNEGSASAAEILAGALRDHNRAVLVGVKTFGKGTVQQIMPLGGGGALKLTVARYFMPAGLTVDGGIMPDVVVLQDDKRDGDEQKEYALGHLSRVAARH